MVALVELRRIEMVCVRHGVCRAIPSNFHPSLRAPKTILYQLGRESIQFSAFQIIYMILRYSDKLGTVEASRPQCDAAIC